MKNIITILLIVFTITACRAQINPYKLNKKIVSLIEIQEAIEYNLNRIKILDSDYYRIYAYRSNNHQKYFYNYFSKKAKERMTELFEGKWTEEEIKSRINASIKSTLDTLNSHNGYYKDAKKIAKRDSLPLQRVWDSMIVARKEESKKSILKNKNVPLQVISIAGYLRDSLFLPYLKNMDKGNYVSEEVELALARYGEEPYLSNAVEDHYNSGDFGKLAYICSNEVIEKLYEYAMTREGLDCDSNGMECYSLLAESAMNKLVTLFRSEDMAKEMREVKYKYEYPDYRKPDKAYEKKMRVITKKYYKQFKQQEPDCENVPVYAW